MAELCPQQDIDVALGRRRGGRLREAGAVSQHVLSCFFFQAEDGIRDYKVTGVQTCALPISAAVALLAAVLVPRSIRKPFAAIICALGFLAAIVLAAILYSHSADAHGVISDALRRDRVAALAQIIVAGAGLLAVGVSYSERTRGTHVAEYYALLAAAGAGMTFFVGANNLMTLFLSLEWFSISLYVLCAIDVEVEGSLEAGLKYLIVGGFGSAILLFGSALVYGATGELQFYRIASAVGQPALSHGPRLLV